MDKEMRKMNKLLLRAEEKSKPVFDKKIIPVLLIIGMFCLILFTPIFKPKQITITNKYSSAKTIVNLGQLGLITPSGVKDKERVNLLFLGIPGQGNSAPYLTDSIIIINSGPRGETPIAISIPRDLLVKFPNKNYYTKINSLYKWGGTGEQGIELITTSLNEITGLMFDYFVVLDLNGVEKIIDKLKGIDVFVENDIYDIKFPNPDGSYEIFSLEKGNQHLDGKTALKYIRTRHDTGGDFARIKRQQQVINAIKYKIFSLNPFWNFPAVLNIWNTLNKHTYSNIGITDLKYVWNLTKRTNFNEINFITISNQLDDNQLLVSDTITLGGKTAYILKPRAGAGNYSEIREHINQLIKQQ